MAKKATALLMAMLLALALAGCGENKANTNRPGSDSNNTTNNGTANNNGGTVDDGVTDSNGAADNGTSRSGGARYRDNGNDKAFNDNHGSTFGGAGEELQRDAQQFPPTVYDWKTASSMTRTAFCWTAKTAAGHKEKGVGDSGCLRPFAVLPAAEAAYAGMR